MPVAVCPNGHRIQIQDAHIGRTITCPSCHASFLAIAQQGVPPGPGGPGEDAFTDMGAGGMPPPGGGVMKRKASSGDLAGKANWFIGKPLLFFGLVLVLFGRGCDSISLRSVGRTNAQFQMAMHDFQKKNMELAPDKQEKLSDNKALKQLGEDASNAMLSHNMWAYWYVWVFVFGTLLLMIGLLIIAFTGQGSERWVAYIIIAIVSFSIYVGGAAWLESVVSSFSATAPTKNLPMDGPMGPGFPPIKGPK
jgi:hypothetical protein